MGNTLSKGMGKFVKMKPRYPGDIGYNLGIYTPIPDYKNYDDRHIAMQAEATAAISSLSRENGEVVMIVASMSSGIAAYKAAENYADAVKQYTKGEFDEEFLTVQNLSRVLPREALHAEVFAENEKNHVRTVEMVARALPEHYIDIPSDTEEVHRSVSSRSSVALKPWEDWTFELHHWLPKVMLNTDVMVYHGDKSFSRSGSLEQATALAIQYGLWVPLDARAGRNMDVKDIQGRDISPLDQAWEDAKQVVWSVEKGFRTETSVALLLTRFMYEHWRRNPKAAPKGAMVHEHAHETVKNQSDEDLKKMDALQDMMLTYMAQKCDWSTLQPILESDADLNNFWQEQVEPKKKNKLDTEAAWETLFSYLPRGGYHYPEVEVKELTYRDEPSAIVQFPKQRGKSFRKLGAHEDPFDPKWGAKQLYPNSGYVWDYNRLGVTGDVKQSPSGDKMTRSQVAAYLTATSMDSDRMPLSKPNRFLYLDNSKSGDRAAKFMEQNQIADWKEAASIHSSVEEGGKSFYQDVVKVNDEKYRQRHNQLLNMKSWREDYEIGNILTLSNIKEMVGQFEGRRKGVEAYRTEAIAADGPEKVGEAADVIAKAADFQGVIIPKGAVLDDNQYGQIFHAVAVATGQVERPYVGGDYSMQFFYDDETDNPPREIDFGDVLLLVGKPIQYALEKGNVPPYRAIVYTAQLFDIYERLVDPVRCNVGDNALDLNQIHAISPNFTSFMQDAKKAKEIQELWSDLVGVTYENGRIVKQGKILEEGMHAFDKGLDLPFMSDKYKSARAALENRIAQGGQKSTNTDGVVIKGPRGGLGRRFG